MGIGEKYTTSREQGGEEEAGSSAFLWQVQDFESLVEVLIEVGSFYKMDRL